MMDDEHLVPIDEIEDGSTFKAPKLIVEGRDDNISIQLSRIDAMELKQFVDAPASSEMENHWIDLLDRISTAIEKSLIKDGDD